MNNKIYNIKNNKKGFTLVELLVVIVILGILATLAIMSFAGKTDVAKVNKAKADARSLMSALEIYKLDYGAYPGLMTVWQDEDIRDKYFKVIPKKETVLAYTIMDDGDYYFEIESGIADFNPNNNDGIYKKGEGMSGVGAWRLRTGIGVVTPLNIDTPYP